MFVLKHLRFCIDATIKFNNYIYSNNETYARLLFAFTIFYGWQLIKPELIKAKIKLLFRLYFLIKNYILVLNLAVFIITI